MCKHVHLGSEVCSTPRQLVKLVGGVERIVWLDHHGELDWCLCIVDLPETFDRASLKWTSDAMAKTFVVNR